MCLITFIKQRRIKRNNEKIRRSHAREMKFEGFNENHKFLFYECPKCEIPYSNIQFREEGIKPNSVITCDCCGADLLVPDYRSFYKVIRDNGYYDW